MRGITSPLQSAGEWGLVFDGVGINKYACEPHVDSGMKGAIIVGDVVEGVYDVTTTELTMLGGFGAALVSLLAFGGFLWALRRLDDRRDR